MPQTVSSMGALWVNLILFSYSDMKLEKEIFPAATDSRVIRPVSDIIMSHNESY